MTLTQLKLKTLNDNPYTIAYAMLHELSHFELGHLNMTLEEHMNESEEKKKKMSVMQT